MTEFSKYTSLKLLISYLLLLGLMAIAVWFLFKQQANLNNQIAIENSDKKQLIYTELIRDLYESDNHARAALQTFDENSQTVFLKKNALVISKIEFLKNNDLAAERVLLDTLTTYLKHKEQSILNLRKLQKVNEKSAIGIALQKIKNLEDVKGKLTLNSFVKNPNQLTPYEKKIAEDYINYLNKNVPKDSTNTISNAEADSVLTASKKILEDAQKKTNQRLIVIKNKEIELLQNELLITQELSDVIFRLRSAAELEERKILSIKTENQKKTLDLLQIAAMTCLIVVLFFFLLLSFDFFKNKMYRQELEIEKQKTEKLLESREQLMMTVSHDIKTPLQSLLGNTEKLLASESQFKNRDSLIKIKSATHYIQQLVSGLLDYVRMEKGKVSVIETAFVINDLVKETAQNIADLNQEKALELILKIEATNGFTYYGDYNKLRQILYNLMGNAFKFTKKGSVSVITNIVENKLQISIEDTGIGISKNDIEKIFKPFTQANSQIEILFGGTGLGLSICNRLIQLLEGTITVQSEENVGSKFQISLPIKPVPPTKRINKIELDTCVLLDDDENQLELTKSLLQPYFNQVLSFTNGEKAIQFIENNKVSLVITDIQMPLMNGFEFLKLVKTSETFKSIPIVAISGNLPEDKDFLTEHRFDYFLSKPYTSSQLLTLISEISQKSITIKKSDNKVFPEFLITFIGDDKNKIIEFLKNYLTDFEKDKATFEQAVEEANLKVIGAIAHKMQTMICQFQEVDLLKMLKSVEEKCKTSHTIDEKELQDIKRHLTIFHQKIKHLIQTD